MHISRTGLVRESSLRGSPCKRLLQTRLRHRQLHGWRSRSPNSDGSESDGRPPASFSHGSKSPSTGSGRRSAPSSDPDCISRTRLQGSIDDCCGDCRQGDQRELREVDMAPRRACATRSFACTSSRDAHPILGSRTEQRGVRRASRSCHSRDAGAPWS